MKKEKSKRKKESNKGNIGKEKANKSLSVDNSSDLKEPKEISEISAFEFVELKMKYKNLDK